MKFESLLKNNKVFTQTMLDEYNRRPLTVYCAEDLGMCRRAELKENELVT